MNLEHLNGEQRAAVTAGAGPVIVYAGPGSGKTRVLTQRLAWLVREQGVYPGAIMAVTFTNRAAGEMRNRAEALLGGRLRGATVGTFHSICARLLRIEADHHAWTPNYLIFDADDQIAAVKLVLADLGIRNDRRTAREVVGRISNAKCELVTPEAYVAPSYDHLVVERVYPRYQDLLLAANAMDFGDLLMQTVFLLRDNEDLRAKYGRNVEHLLVDEFQDTNLAQYRLVRLFAQPQENVFVVGDEDQAIYSWRGADWRNVASFRRDYPHAQSYRLEQNYRSTQVVLDAARAVISHNPQRVDKALFTTRERGEKLRLFAAYDDVEEADHVLASLGERLRVDGRQWRDFAVMYRSHYQSRALEEAFINARVPYRLVRGIAFYNRMEVRDMMAFLRLAHNPNDHISLQRIVNVPRRGIGRKTLAAFEAWRKAAALGCGEALALLARGAETPLTPRAASRLREFARLSEEWLRVVATGDLPLLFDRILRSTGYLTWLGEVSDDAEQVEEREENLAELRGQLEQAMELEQGLGEFLAEKALFADADVQDPFLDAVLLMTLHATKGTEFPVVFITGVEEGLLPHSRALYDPEQLAEERRLFYVGMTRAMDELFLSCAFRRRRGAYAVQEPSRFLDDIPQELLDSSSSPGLRREFVPPAPAADSAWGPAPTVAAPQPQLQFHTGMRVMHKHFGEGMVIESAAMRDDEEVTVAFMAHGIKRLSASISGLRELGQPRGDAGHDSLRDRGLAH